MAKPLTEGEVMSAFAPYTPNRSTPEIQSHITPVLWIMGMKP